MIVATWTGLSVLSLVVIGFVACCCGGPQQQQQQQQQVVIGDENEEAKRVCPECGMENPREASHCGDCGFTFKSGTSDEVDQDA